MGFLGSSQALRHPLRCGWLLVFLVLFPAVSTMPLPLAWADPASPLHEKWPVCDGRSASRTQQVSFVHLSDMHANYNREGDGSSPVSRVRGYYETVKKENPFTVFTNGGDDYEKGSIAEELSHGRSTREVVQALRYDVRTLGNHDFAWGIEEFLQFSRDSSAMVLSANTRNNRDMSGPLQDVVAGWTDFGVLTVGCVRIGFFGLTARPYGADGRQHDGPIYPEHPALQLDSDYLEIAGRVIAKYRREVDVLVLVSHLGLTDDITLAERTSGIDLILGGHSHSTLEKPMRVKDTAIVHVGAQVEHIGRYDLFYDLQRKKITDSRFELAANQPGKIPSDEGTEKAVARILQPWQQELGETVTELKNDQPQPAMALLAARAAVQKLRIDAAFVGHWSVWEKLRRGGLTRQDILNGFRVEREPVGTPGSSSLYLLEVMGSDLLHARAAVTDTAYWGPSEINPAAFYTVAMQKPLALNQQQSFARTIAVSPPRPAAELWEIVVAYAGDLNDRSLALDEGSDNRRIEELLAHLPDTGKKHPAL